MNRSKKLCVLLGILAAVCGATLIVLQVEEQQEKIKNSDAIILEIPTDSVDALSWEYEAQTLSFHKDGGWLYDGDEHFPVSEEALSEMLEQFEAFGAAFVIEDVEDFGQYGLDDPICTVELTAEGQSHRILLGDYSKMDSQRYVSIGDGNVYLVKHDPLDEFSAKLSAVIDHDKIPMFEQVRGIQFSGSENYTITYQEDSPDTYCADDVYFVSRNGKSLPLDTELVEGYLRSLTNLGLTDYVSYHVTDEELHKYGLEQPDLTVTVQYTPEDGNGEEVSFVLHISRDPSDSGEEEEYSAYVRVGESQIVYQISSDRYEILTDASYNALRHQELLSADFADILQIDVSLEGTQYTFITKGKDDEISLLYQDEELETSDFQDALKNLTAEEFTDEQPAQKEEIRVTILLDNERFPEVEIALYRYDGARCLAVVDGESTAFVERESVVDLIEAVRSVVL